MESFGDVLFAIRKNHFKENARDFAKRCGISKSCLLRIEQGLTLNPSRETIKKIETSLNCDFSKLDLKWDEKNYSMKKIRFQKVLEKRGNTIVHEIDSLRLLMNAEIMDIDEQQLMGWKKRIEEHLDKVCEDVLNSVVTDDKNNGKEEWLDSIFLTDE